MATTIYLVLDTRRPVEGKMYPIKIRIKHNETDSSRCTDYVVSKESWDNKKHRLKSSFPNYKEINDELIKKCSIYEKYIKRNEDSYLFNSMTAADIFHAADDELKKPNSGGALTFLLSL